MEPNKIDLSNNNAQIVMKIINIKLELRWSIWKCELTWSSGQREVQEGDLFYQGCDGKLLSPPQTQASSKFVCDVMVVRR